MSKKHYSILLFTIPIIILFHSCEKTYTTHASGIVIDKDTRQPIDGAIVSIQDGVGISGTEWFDSNSKYSSGRKVITYTDSDGYFSLLLKDHEYPPFLGVMKDGYSGFILEGSGWGEEIKGLNYGENSDLVLVGTSTRPGEGYILKAFTFKAIENFDYVAICALSYFRCKSFTSSEPINVSFYVLENSYFPYAISYSRNNEQKMKIDSIFIYNIETPVDTIYF